MLSVKQAVPVRALHATPQRVSFSEGQLVLLIIQLILVAPLRSVLANPCVRRLCFVLILQGPFAQRRVQEVCVWYFVDTGQSIG